MHRTILVIGSVTAEQYKEIRLDALRQGYKPKVVRTTFDEFFLGPEGLIRKYWSDEGPLSGEDFYSAYTAGTKEHCHGFAKQHLSSFGPPIIAMILDEAAWDLWGSSGNEYFMDSALAELESYTRWIAYESGKVELAGF